MRLRFDHAHLRGDGRAITVISLQSRKPIVQCEQRLFGWPVGVMDEEGPVEPLGKLDEISAVALEAFLITLTQLLSAPDGHALIALDRGELGTSAIGKLFFRWIEDLHEMAADSLGCNCLKTCGRCIYRLQPVAEQDAFGEAA